MTAVTERMLLALNVSTAKFEQLGAEGGEFDAHRRRRRLANNVEEIQE